MKILRKIASVLLCVTLALPFFSFVSCTGAVVRKVLAAAAEQKIAAIGVELGLSMENTTDGETEGLGFTFDGMLNFPSAQGDLSLTTSNTKKGKTDRTYAYAFLREEHLFAVDSMQEIENFNGVTLKAKSFLEEVDEEQLAQLQELFKELDIQELMQQELVETVAFFDFMGVIEGKDEEVTVDLNAFLYELLADCKKVVDSLKSETTLREILEHKTVVKYGEHFLRDTSVEELQEDIDEVAEKVKELGGESDIVQYISALKEVPVPLFASSYKYFVEILFSNEMSLVLQEMGMAKRLDEITFADAEEALKTQFGDDWKKELFKYFEKTTKEEFVLTIDWAQGDFVFSLKDMKLTLALNDDHSVRSMAVQGNFSLTQNANSISLSLVLKQSYFAEEQTLTNIDNAAVETYKIAQPDGVAQEGLYINLGVLVTPVFPSVSRNYLVYPVYADGEIVDFQVFYGTQEMPAQYDAASGELSFRAGFIEDGVSNTDVNVKLYCEVYEERGTMIVELLALENADGYVCLPLGNASVRLIPLAEYLTQAP